MACPLQAGTRAQAEGLLARVGSAGPLNLEQALTATFGHAQRSQCVSGEAVGDLELDRDDSGEGSVGALVSQRRLEFEVEGTRLIHGIDHDPAKQALVAGMRHFVRTTKRRLIAEGVEAEADVQTLDVRLVQGYRFGRSARCPRVAAASLALLMVVPEYTVDIYYTRRAGAGPRVDHVQLRAADVTGDS